MDLTKLRWTKNVNHLELGNLAYSDLAPAHSPAVESIPRLIVQVLSRGLNTSTNGVSVHFSGLDLLARSLNSGRFSGLMQDLSLQTSCCRGTRTL
jgi:hypothetical protein